MSKRRASMREGPLADLFRATDDAGAADPPPGSSAPAPASVPAPFDEEPLPPPTPLPVRDALPFTPAARAASSYLASIRVVGVGGAGMNAVARMIETDLRGVEFVAVNTDAQQLAMSDATVKVALGREQTRGLGAGGDYELGKRVAEAGGDRLREAYDHVKRALRGSDMVFVAVGEGGGTGSGAAPVVARIARELGALTVAIVTMPFGFEGSRRQTVADLGLERLAGQVDTVIVVPNDRLLQVLDRGTSMLDAFRVADDVLRQGVQGICDLITRPGLINLDFADVRTVMQTSGNALMGVGMASGSTRGIDAARRAIASPLLGREIRGASGIVLSIAGGDDLGLVEVTEAAAIVREAATEDANIIFGASVDPDLTGQFWVTVIATGFDGDLETVVAQQPTMTTGTGTDSWRRDRPPARAPKFEASDDLDVPAFLRNR
jgi:cell division protein FtsZ